MTEFLAYEHAANVAELRASIRKRIEQKQKGANIIDADFVVIPNDAKALESGDRTGEH